MTVTVEAHTGVFGRSGVTATLYLGDTVDSSGISATESTFRPGCYQFTSSKTTGIYRVDLFAALATQPFWYGWVNFAKWPFVAVDSYAEALGSANVIPNGTGTLQSSQLAGTSTAVLQFALGGNLAGYCCTMSIIRGTGEGQQRVITGYINGTLTATVDRAWDRALDTTSVYEITATQVPAMSTGQGFVFGVASTLNAKLVSFDTGVLDTIAAAVWNFAKTSLTTVGSVGKYIVDAFTVVEDDLDAISSAVSGGAGANSVTIVVEDENGDPLQNATVTAKLNGSISDTGLTDVDGEYILHLDDGTYSLAITCPGYTGAGNPALVVNGDETPAAYTLTAMTITPSDPPFVTGYLVVRTAGDPDPGVVVSIAMKEVATGETGSAYKDDPITVVSDASGIATFTNLSAGAVYQIRFDEDGEEWTGEFTAGNTTFEIKSFVG